MAPEISKRRQTFYVAVTFREGSGSVENIDLVFETKCALYVSDIILENSHIKFWLFFTVDRTCMFHADRMSSAEDVRDVQMISLSCR